MNARGMDAVGSLRVPMSSQDTIENIQDQNRLSVTYAQDHFREVIICHYT